MELLRLHVALHLLTWRGYIQGFAEAPNQHGRQNFRGIEQRVLLRRARRKRIRQVDETSSMRSILLPCKGRGASNGQRLPHLGLTPVRRWSAARRPVPTSRDPQLVMQEGRIGESGVADAVLRYPRSPYTKTLLAAVPRIQSTRQ